MATTNPLEILGPTLLEAIRQVVRAEIEAHRDAAPQTVELMSPPEASEALGGRPSAETIVAWVKAGRLPVRTTNIADNPKRMKYLVRLEEVRTAMMPPAVKESAPEVSNIDAARARARAAAAKA
jgi:hypothetical protein